MSQSAITWKTTSIPKRPTIIGLGHRKRVGKDTLAAYMMSAAIGRGFSPYRRAFADLLKTVCYQAFGHYGLHSRGHYESNANERNEVLPDIGKTPRDIWIEVGNKLREVYPDVWLDAVLYEATRNSQLDRFIVVPDIRYPNEVQAIQDAGGVVLKVVRPQVEDTSDVADDALDGFDGWDCVVCNGGSKQDLALTAKVLLDCLEWKEVVA